MEVRCNVRFSIGGEEASTLRASASNNAPAGRTLGEFMAQGCAPLDVQSLKVIPDGAVAEKLYGSADQV